MEEEAIKVIRRGPKWVAARQNAEAVDAWHRQTVTCGTDVAEPAPTVCEAHIFIESSEALPVDAPECLHSVVLPVEATLHDAAPAVLSDPLLTRVTELAPGLVEVHVPDELQVCGQPVASLAAPTPVSNAHITSDASAVPQNVELSATDECIATADVQERAVESCCLLQESVIDPVAAEPSNVVHAPLQAVSHAPASVDVGVMLPEAAASKAFDEQPTTAVSRTPQLDVQQSHLQDEPTGSAPTASKACTVHTSAECTATEVTPPRFRLTVAVEDASTPTVKSAGIVSAGTPCSRPQFMRSPTHMWRAAATATMGGASPFTPLSPLHSLAGVASLTPMLGKPMFASVVASTLTAAVALTPTSRTVLVPPQD
ncbi:MAG: hypothetical protein EOO38_07400 [Cytophagaceae bacterium]|nr:MAG: hypothetical protein EOO38_07400 [Cytophagaceae bacterium]